MFSVAHPSVRFVCVFLHISNGEHLEILGRAHMLSRNSASDVGEHVVFNADLAFQVAPVQLCKPSESESVSCALIVNIIITVPVDGCARARALHVCYVYTRRVFARGPRA